MSMNSVTVYYGPCNSFNTYTHKPHKLRGLVDRLQKLGYRLYLVPVEFINYCKIEMCGHAVFRCNIKNLRYNTSHELDPVCQRAIDAVVESQVKFRRARTYLWLWTLIEEQVMTRTAHGPRDSWPAELKLETFADIDECVKCCGILAFEK